MQTPQGYEIVDGRVVPVDWIEIIFNPSFPYRLVHMALAAFLATALFVAASGAWHMLKGSAKPHAQKMFSMAMWMLLITAPLQIIAGDFHGLNTLEHQPAKIAAMEGHWENEPGEEGVPLILFGWPDMEAEETKYALKIPHLGSLILTHTWDGQFEGLKSFAPEDRPYAPVVFWSFRIMVALGMLMLLLGVCGLWLRWKKRLYESPLFLKFALAMGPAGLIAILAGWFTTEVGRQPWVVYGVMRTVDAASDHSVAALTTTLVAFVVVYFAVFGIGVKYMLSLIKEGPEEHHDPADGEDSTHRPARPLSAVSDEVKL
ncbi:cytochrome ubiquinol oxidase subunit I [Neptunomonas phycophila]